MRIGIRLACIGLALGVGVAFAGLFAAKAVQETASPRTHAPAVPTAPAAASTAIPRNGSRPLTVPVALKVSGVIDGLPSGVSPTRVTVKAGARTFNATVSGNTYTANLTGLEHTAMVSVEVEAPRVRYRSVLGSFLDLKMHSGGDRRVTLAEHASLRVSPLTTATAWMVRHGFGGRDASSTAEWRRALQSIDGDSLIRMAYVLGGYADGRVGIGLEYTDGIALIEDEAAYRAVLGSRTAMDSKNWLADTGDGRAIVSPTSLPANFAMLGAVPLDDLVPAQTAKVVQRLADGGYRVSEPDIGMTAFSRLELTAAVDARGRLVLSPKAAFEVEQNVPADHRDGGLDWALSALNAIELRRLTDADGVGGLWLFVSRWTDTFIFAPSPRQQERAETQVLSGLDLDGLRNVPSWAREHQVRALPWFCREARFMPSDAEVFKSCEYVLHQFLAYDSGVMINFGRKTSADLTPIAGSPGPSFQWHEDATGKVSIEYAETSVDYWLIDPPGAAYGRVLFLAEDRQGDRLAGITIALADDGITLGNDEIVGSWLNSFSVGVVNLYPDPGNFFFLDRYSDGSGRQRGFSADGSSDITPTTWSYQQGIIRDMRRVAYYDDGHRERVLDCGQALSNGANRCINERLRHFVPMKRLGGKRVAGIEHLYYNPAYFDQTSDVSIVSFSRPNFYDCDAGACSGGSGMSTAEAVLVYPAPLVVDAGLRASTRSDSRTRLNPPFAQVGSAMTSAGFKATAESGEIMGMRWLAVIEKAAGVSAGSRPAMRHFQVGQRLQPVRLGFERRESF